MRPLTIVMLGWLASGCGSKLNPPTETMPTDSGSVPTDTGGVADAGSEVAADVGVGPSEGRTCKRLADAMCGAATEACCKTLGITYAAGGCREAAMAYCNARIDAVMLGRATYDDSRLEDCAKWWTSAITGCQLEFIPYLSGSLGCAQMFNGTKAPGTACASSAECNSLTGTVAYCDQSTKRCRVSSVVKEGSECNFTGSQLRYCDDGLYCDLTGATSACRKELATGAECVSANYIACGYSSTCVDGKCGTGLASGEACTENHQCSSWSCKMGTCTSVLYPQVDKSLCNAGTAG